MRRDLPTGTVTFCFTDVEGSTRLLHSLGAEAYAQALAEHRVLIREACSAQGGAEVDTQGDAFFFAFASAPAALEAAAAFTQALEPGPIRVRVGLHTGTPHLAEEGYVGADVHLAARLAAAAHGGQVVLSASTAALVGAPGSEPRAFALRDLGEHRFKDLAVPERVYQLGEGSFPPLKSLYRSNLPVPANPLVGRKKELADVLRLFQEGARIVTVTGPGGVGKTRFSLAAAADVAELFPDGIWFVPLAPLRDADLVLPTAAAVVGADGDLARHLATAECLLLLDNVEHVIDAAAGVARLVSDCPGLRVLVTSREALRVASEREYPLAPLPESPSVELFRQRVSAVAPELEVDFADAAAICDRLDRLPLAIELVAARTKALTPAQILERISQRLDLLRGGRDADPRQRTLSATIEWSYDLLGPDEQRLFRSLSVFAGGCTLEAAEEVVGADLDTLQSLVDKSLVRFTNGRYWMLETIREYASGRLDEAGAQDEVQRDHAEWVLRLAAGIEGRRVFDETARERFTRELNNFRSALAWAELRGHTDVQLGLIGRSWLYWWDRGSSGEGLRWVESALDRGAGERNKATADVLAAGAMFASRAGDQERLKAYAEESLAIARETADRQGEIWPLIFLGIWAGQERDYARSAAQYEEAIAIALESGSRELVGITLNNLGVNEAARGDYARAVALFDDARAISRELGALEDVALETLNLASALGMVDRVDEAAVEAFDGLSLALDLESDRTILLGLEVVAELQHARGDGAGAARLVGAVESVGDRLGEAVGAPELFEPMVERLVAVLGPDAYATAVAEGRAMSLEAAAETALGYLDAR